jgi:hypothetical protein
MNWHDRWSRCQPTSKKSLTFRAEHQAFQEKTTVLFNIWE